MKIENLLESFNYRADIKWKSYSTKDEGSFTIDGESYNILIEYFESDLKLKSTNRSFNTIIQVAFEREIGGFKHIEKIESKNAFKVIGAVMNGIKDHLVFDAVDIIIFSAKKITNDSLETFQKRSKLYARLAENLHKSVNFAYLKTPFKDQNGDHYILVNNSIKLTDEEIKNILAQEFQ